MSALRRMAPHMRSYRGLLIIGLFTVVLPVAMELIMPRMIQYIVDRGIRAESMQAVVRGSLILLGTAAIGALATLGQGICRAQLSQGIAFDLRNGLFAHIQELSFANLDQMQTGQLMTRVSSDVDTVRMFLSAGLALLLRALIMIAGSMVMMMLIDWRLTLTMLLLLAVAGAILRILMHTAQPLFTQVQQKLAVLNTIVQEALAGVRVVKAYVRERYEMDRFGDGNRDYRDQNIRVGRLMAAALPLIALLTNIGLVAILWLGGIDVIGGRLSVGELLAFNYYLLIGMAPLLLLSNILMMVSRAEASAARIVELWDTEPLIKTAPSPYLPRLRVSGERQGQAQGRIVFDKVLFAYGESGTTPWPANAGAGANRRNGVEDEPADAGDAYGVHEDVLRRISFAVEPGQQIALLGATGSGKSTLVNLIPRFYDVTGGRITVDGVDVRQWEPQALRRQIGMVLQDTTLFSGTVRENIAYGRPDAPWGDVIAAARAAQAHEFIVAMPDGYDSLVEARGANLSGGQKQRIAIARALLIDPAILILDDSTSSVDFETEVRLQAELEHVMAGRTTLIVAQRINSVLHADQILVLEDGEITARGTHHELLQSSPIYREIYQSQLGVNGME